MSRVILAIDPATKTGFALGGDKIPTISGVWNLKPRRLEGGGMRFVRLLEELEGIQNAAAPTLVVFEEVRRHKGTDAAHIYGGIVGHISSWCEKKEIPYTSVPVQHIKKFATGKGNAGKAEVMNAMRIWGFSPRDDNEADALALLYFVLHGGLK